MEALAAHDAERHEMRAGCGRKEPALTLREIEALRGSDQGVLCHVALESVEGLLRDCTLRVLHPGEVLLRAGELNKVMYLIVEGTLTIHLDTKDSETVATLGPGQSVGELSVIDRSPASAFVVAAAPSRLLQVEEATFWGLIAASHEFSNNMLLMLANRLRANNQTISHTTQLKNQFEQESRFDKLTSLYNRRWLDEQLPRLIQRFAFDDAPLSILMLDVDHFKRFNDTFGHPAGDQILRGVSQMMRSRLRPLDQAARYGGEEFVVILPNTDLAGALCAAERLRVAMAFVTEQTEQGQKVPAVTASFGVAQVAPGETAAQAISRADAALYRAKSNGRNRVEK